MNLLRKKSLIQFTAGSPAYAGNPGSPGRAGYYRTDTFTAKVPVRGIVRYRISNNSSYGLDPGDSFVDIQPAQGGGFIVTVLRVTGYTTTTTTTKTWIPEVPATPPTPAVAAVPPTATELNVGWNGGANTVARASGDAAFSFKIPVTSIGVAVGLTDAAANGDYRRIKYGVYASRGKISFVEGGSVIGPPVAYSDGDEITVSRSGSSVDYIIGSLVVRSSASTLPTEIFGTAALYMAGDSVVDASFGAASAVSKGTMLPMTAEAYAGVYAQSLNSMLPMTGLATGRQYVGADAAMLPMTALASNRPSGESRARMLPLQGAATGRQFTSVSSTSMEPMVGMGADKEYASSATKLEPIEGLANDGLLMPEIAVALTSMSYMLSASYGTTGEVGSSDASMGPLRRGLSADRPYGESTASFEPMTGQTGLFVLLEGEAALTAPSPRLRANGRSSQGDNSFTYRAPMATLSAFGGGNAKLRAPVAGLSASATGTNWGKAAIEAPSALLSATGTTSATASAALQSPMSALIGYGGAVANITLTGRHTVQASATAGSIGGAALTVPLFQLVASGTAQNYGGADLLAPSPRMGDRLQAWLVAPVGRLTAIGSATITATFEAYAVNLNHIQGGEDTVDEVTRYTNFPFTHVVRYQNSYYGANSTGLYLLEGTTDDAAPIAWAVTTAMMELGSPKLKTVASAYFGGRFGPSSTITLSAGEKTPVSYSFSTPRDALAQNHRQVFGRGVKARYYTLAVSGEGECELDDITFGIHTTTRRI